MIEAVGKDPIVHLLVYQADGQLGLCQQLRVGTLDPEDLRRRWILTRCHGL
jgi:hypothetical protein